MEIFAVVDPSWHPFLREIGLLPPEPTPPNRTRLPRAVVPSRAATPPPSAETVLAGLQARQRELRKSLAIDVADSVPALRQRLADLARTGRITAFQAAKGEAEIHRLAALAASARQVFA